MNQLQHIDQTHIRTTMRDWLASRCPATDNAPVSMTEAGWLALCAGTRKEEAKKARTGESNSRCPHCKGEHRPKNLKIIKLNEKGEIMRAKNPIGECNVCTEKATVRMIHGLPTCGTCSTIFSHVNNRLASVAKAVIHLGKTDEMINLLMEETGTAKVMLDDKTDAIMKRISAAVQYRGENVEELAAIIEALGPEYDNALGLLNHAKEQLIESAKKLESMGADRDALSLRCGSLESERDALAERVSELEKEREAMTTMAEPIQPPQTTPEPSPQQQIIVTASQTAAGMVPTEVFNLALAQIEGKVSGLSANRLRALARVQ